MVEARDLSGGARLRDSGCGGAIAGLRSTAHGLERRVPRSDEPSEVAEPGQLSCCIRALRTARHSKAIPPRTGDPAGRRERGTRRRSRRSPGAGSKPSGRTKLGVLGIQGSRLERPDRARLHNSGVASGRTESHPHRAPTGATREVDRPQAISPSRLGPSARVSWRPRRALIGLLCRGPGLARRSHG